MKRISFISAIFLFLVACSGLKKEKVDLIVTNATIYTVDKNFRTTEALVVKNGKFEATGQTQSILDKYTADKVIDMKGKYIYPGFIDPHCHFYGYSMNLRQVNLVGTKSFDEIIQKLKDANQGSKAKWIIGRGWDQNDWQEKKYPSKTRLDKAFPETPVFLRRIDGHAAIVNSTALKIANIDASQEVRGGKILSENGEPTGVLIDNAITLVSRHIPEPTRKEKINNLKKGQQNCFNVGLTMVADAGLDYEPIHLMDSLQKEGLKNL